MDELYCVVGRISTFCGETGSVTGREAGALTSMEISITQSVLRKKNTFFSKNIFFRCRFVLRQCFRGGSFVALL